MWQILLGLILLCSTANAGMVVNPVTGKLDVTGTGSSYSSITQLNGNIGINTVSPSTTLEVNGDINAQAMVLNGDFTINGVRGLGIGTSSPATDIQIGVGSVASGVVLGTGSALIKGDLEVDANLYGGAASLGLRTASAANQACTTTCVRGCVLGQDTAALSYAVVDCSNATADVCICTK